MSKNSDLPPRDPMTGRPQHTPPPQKFGVSRIGQSSGGEIRNVDSGVSSGSAKTGGKIVHT